MEETSSTQHLAKEYLAHHSDGGPVAFFADRQTAGYGQHGRHYYSPKQTGLYMSILLPAQSMMQFRKSGLMTTATAVVLCQVLERFFPDSELTVKWVNDVYKDRAKIAGILTEAVYQLGNDKANLIMGIGINLTTQVFPDEIKGKAGALSADSRVDRNQLAAELLVALLEMVENYEGGSYLDEYRRRCFLLGRFVSVRTGQEMIEGTAVDITKAGALVVEDGEHHRHVIRSGEVEKVNYK